MAMYTLAQRGVEIVTNEQASSTTWLSNMLSEGFAVPTTFSPENVSSLDSLDADTIRNMTDAEYNEMMGIVNTSVATDTSLQEVSDETDLKKAEAKYEADMNRINKKDTRYDNELAEFETERTAVKDEIETLQTVIKENVEKTFKLFS
jgi:hypothetical protein